MPLPCLRKTRAVDAKVEPCPEEQLQDYCGYLPPETPVKSAAHPAVVPRNQTPMEVQVTESKVPGTLELAGVAPAGKRNTAPLWLPG